MDSLVLKSPAKLNLFLKVLNKRADGFHDLETLFERISLFDTIRIKLNSISPKIQIKCNHPHVPIGSKNLVYKVAQMLKEDYKIDQGVHIDIKKNIPVAAGLAGGSSNAATVLIGLNELWKLGLSQRALVSYARKIGSDVAFFLYDSSFAIGTQRGDKIKRVNIKVKLWHVLVLPWIRMYSGEVYGAHNLELTKRTCDVKILLRYLKNNEITKASSCLINDLESAIFRLSPRIRKLKQRVKALTSKGVMVSGSGPSVYALLDNEQEAKALAQKLKKRYKQVFVVSTA